MDHKFEVDDKILKIAQDAAKIEPTMTFEEVIESIVLSIGKYRDITLENFESDHESTV